MAVLAPPDWQNTMDPRQQRSSPANDREQAQQHTNQQSQQMPYNFPLQQQQPQGQWTPSISAQPFYPSFYQNHQQSSPGYPQQPPYFDPSNPQLAQWAYQQMMFSSQQAFQMSPGSRNLPSSSNNEYFAQNPMGQIFNPFPSGTPPPPHQQQQGGQNGGQYPGYHPYRRPTRQGSTQSQSSYAFPESSGASNSSANNNDWRSGIPNPPYARPDASGSSSSVNSMHSQRARTDSNQSGRGSQGGHGTPNGSVRGRPPGGGSPVGGSSSNSNRSHSGSISSQRQSPHHTPSSHSHSHSHSHSPHNNHNLPHPSPPHHRNLSASSNTSSSSGIVRTSSATATTQSPPSSSTASSGTSTPSSTSSLPTSATSSTSSITNTTIPRPTRRSPLSQGTSYSEKRMSRDDSDLAAMIREEAAASDPRHHGRSGGLKGRLRRALTFGTTQIKEEDGTGAGEDDGDDDESIKASTFGKPTSSKLAAPPRTAPRPSADGNVMSDAESTNTIQTSGTATTSATLNANSSNTPSIISATPPPKKRGRAASLFNSRLNASTDNISLSSTVSSASVMIRKLGSMGRLARRNSLAGITSLFKDKEKKKREKEGIVEDNGSDVGVAASSSDGKEKDKKSKKKDKKSSSAKAQASEASVSHVTAELDRSGGSGEWNAAELAGLSPAAKLARQHTLKTNAEAAAKAQKEKEEREAAAAAAKAAAERANGANGSGAGIPVWDRGTHNRSPVKGGGGVRVNEDGTRVFVEDEDEEWSEDGHGRHVSGSGYGQTGNQQQYNAEGWDVDEDDWDGEEEEDVTIRMGMDRVDLNATGNTAGADWQGGEAEEDDEPWATDIRRSEERTRMPSKGILKYTKNHAPFPLSDATNYDQHNYLTDSQHPAQLHTNRARSNSYNSHPSQTEAGPLARIPSPDPDHIDGLHRHGSHSSGGHAPASTASAPSLPPLSFDTSPIRASMDAPQKPLPTATSNAPMFSHSNSSAPTLSLSLNTTAPTLTHRSATAPHKRLAFANNLSVYDTFSSSVYDRRSEPATWSRLTPALAQRIKEELNSYKMEEMEVHAASRIHTQFFV
ncbi:hypothetical protein WG66_011846 [Moniliophthora roreri]|nr:hypothetical protein WG66_011846 [Moniliophthora roreri]